MTSQTFRPTQTNRQLNDLETVENSKGFVFSTLDDKTKRRTGTRALTIIDRTLRIALWQQARKIHRLDLWMRQEKLCHCFRIISCLVHAQRHCFERARHHPTRIGIKLTSKPSAQISQRRKCGVTTGHGPSHQIAMASNIFGQRINIDIRPMFQWILKDRTQQRIVHRQQRLLS